MTVSSPSEQWVAVLESYPGYPSFHCRVTDLVPVRCVVGLLQVIVSFKIWL